MRLVLHAAGISGGGGLRHLLGLLPELARAGAPEDRVTLVARASVARRVGPLPGLELVSLPDSVGGAPLTRVLLDQLWLPTLARQHRADVLVSFANFGPVHPGCPHVVLHTNALFHHTRAFGGLRGSSAPLAQATPRERATLEARARLSRATLERARAIVVPSQAMAAELATARPTLGTRAAVVRHGVDRRLFAAHRASARAHTTFVSPGLGAFYKGLDVLVPAVARLKGEPVVRALARSRDWPDGVTRARAEAASLGVGARLRIEEEIEPESMGDLFEEADALVYPTRCESFGFTLLEALCAGLPVVASDLPVNREIAGDAALYYDPGSVAALAAAMQRLVDEPALREALRAKARARVDGYDWSWARHARELVAVCRAALRA